jgi:hypothetical protein
MCANESSEIERKETGPVSKSQYQSRRGDWIMKTRGSESLSLNLLEYVAG